MEREGIKKYFDIFKGKPARLSELEPATKNAVEILIADKKMVAQKTLDGDEIISYNKQPEQPSSKNDLT